MKKQKEEIAGGVLYGKRGYFDPMLREALIKEIEAGTPGSVIVYQYGVSPTIWRKCTALGKSAAYS